MEKYESYLYKDFLTDDRFIDWILKSDDSLDAFWGDFQRKYPEKKTNMELARRAILKLNESVSVSGEGADEVWQHIQHSISHKKNAKQNVWRRWAGMGVAASLLIGMWFFTDAGKEKSTSREILSALPEKGGEFVTVRNDHLEELSHYLPDSSFVALKSGSELKYAAGFSGELREVFLNGEGYFRVTKNPDRAFMVFSRGLVVRVLGTSFSVKGKGENTSVEVETGSVSVYRNDEKETSLSEVVRLEANQKVDFVRKTSELKKTIVAAPMPILSETVLQTFSFNNQPVSLIFDALEKTYGIEIVYSRETLAHCRLTTSLGKETLFEKLDVICAALSASYEIEGVQIKVVGNKCHRPLTE